MERKNIVILFGGCNTEHEVSLASAYAVISHMNANLYNTILIGITRDGDWYQYTGPIENIQNNTWSSAEYCNKAIISPNRSDHGIIVFKDGGAEVIRVDAVLPILHGKYGEDGTLQGLVELAGIPLIGCDTLSSALCMDKDLAHIVVESTGIKVAPSVVIKEHDNLDEKVSQIKNLKYPLFVKPVKSGSSIGITKVHNESELLSSIKSAFTYDNKVLVEQMVEGFEVGCAVLGTHNPIIGEVDEVEVLTDFLSYDSKYVDTTSVVHVPARIDDATKLRIKEAARKIYDVLECKGFARVDMFLTPNGEIYFNEVNTIPGFTSHSRYPGMLQAAGIPFKEILEKLIG